jgi:hypothetical protein
MKAGSHRELFFVPLHYSAALLFALGKRAKATLPCAFHVTASRVWAFHRGKLKSFLCSWTGSKWLKTQAQATEIALCSFCLNRSPEAV